MLLRKHFNTSSKLVALVGGMAFCAAALTEMTDWLNVERYKNALAESSGHTTEYFAARGLTAEQAAYEVQLSRSYDAHAREKLEEYSRHIGKTLPWNAAAAGVTLLGAAGAYLTRSKKQAAQPAPA